MSTYNGWTNRQTWLVNIWFENHQGLYCLRDESTPDKGWNRINTEEFVDGLMDKIAPDTGLVAALVTDALSQVNWQEIAESWNEEFA